MLASTAPRSATRTLTILFALIAALAAAAAVHATGAQAADTTKPVVDFGTAIHEGDVITDPNQLFTISATDAEGTVIRLDCRINTDTFAECPTSWIPFIEQGENTLYVEAEDDSGNVAAETLTFRVDYTPPTIAITTATQITNSPSVTNYFEYSDDGSGILTVECKFDTDAYTPCDVGYFHANLSEGLHTFTLHAVDYAGNESTATHNTRVDTTAPGLQIDAASVFANASPQLAFTGTDPSPITYTCWIDNDFPQSCGSPWTPPDPLATGQYVFWVQATDAVANSTTASKQINIDITAPGVSFDEPRNGGFTNDATPDSAFTVDNTDGDLASTKCKVDTGAYADCISPLTTPTLSESTHNVVVKVTDTLGNVNTAIDSFSVDVTPPTLSITSPSENDIFATTTPKLHFLVMLTEPDFFGVQCATDEEAPVNCTEPYTPAPLSQGPHKFTVIATDIHDNVVTKSVNFTVDTVAPIPIITAPGAFQMLATSTPVITFVTSATDVATRTCQFDGSGPHYPCASPYTTPTLTDGDHLVTVDFTDTAGNVGTANVPFAIDATSPNLTITSPGATSTTTDHNPVVTFTVADPNGHLDSVVCQVDGGPDVACTSPFSPPTLADGVHSITITARDTYGNLRTASVSIAVTTPVVTPPDPPTISLPLLGKFPASAKYAKPITGPLTCDTSCVLKLELTIGKKKLVLKPMTLPAGATSATIKLPAATVKKIKKALKKDKKTKISLKVTPSNTAGDGIPKVIKLK